ncbi:MAG: type II secretion system protein N [Pseudoruegeria sp.]
MKHRWPVLLAHQTPKGSPMRRLARFALFPACIAFGFAVVDLGLSLSAPPASQGSAAQISSAAPVPLSAKTETTPASWPALFGVYQPPEPQPPTPVAPPLPPTPPLESLGYSLRGVFSNETESWAILAHPQGGKIMRLGDTLIDGVTITEISPEGIWVETARGREQLGFAK